MVHTNAPSDRTARCIALVGPYLSGKTTLLESLLARTGAISRQGKLSEGNTVGDASAEARAHGMSVELNSADVEFLGDTFTFIDCPGSIEFQHESAAILSACDAVVVVCEPDAKRMPALQLILKRLDDLNLPRFLFLNKIDKFNAPVRSLLPMLQPASSKPLVLRQIPIWDNGIATGFVDLALERAFVYREHAASKMVDLPSELHEREVDARFSMLEHLADYDDELMEQLLSDMEPPRDKVFDDLSNELRDGQICPVLLGSAENGNGILRLLKALRHEAPFVERTAKRLKLENTTSAALVLKTMHTAHAGKLSLARVLTGTLSDNETVRGALKDERISGLFAMSGLDAKKCSIARAGDTVALGRLDALQSSETITTGKGGIVQVPIPPPPQPVYCRTISVAERKDDVKLTTALAKLIEEDPSLALVQDQSTSEMVLWGQGEMHLRVSLEKLARKYSVSAQAGSRQVPYKETIRGSIELRGRHKKQSGGHGQFGDVVLNIKPLPRGDGFKFTDTITGGVVPKQFIPSVAHGVEDFLTSGPLGFPVVDLEVTLTDGSYHTVDSSDMAFRLAGRLAMSEGLAQCRPVLLEPVMAVEVTVPCDATAKVNGIIAQRRGQILGFDAREGWPGWDVVEAHIPEAEIQDLIVELRSVTAGVGTYTTRFDHLSEISGKLAEQALQVREAAQ